jgi:hypothetical protein
MAAMFLGSVSLVSCLTTSILLLKFDYVVFIDLPLASLA